MIVKKKSNDDATRVLLQIAAWLHARSIDVYVEPQVFQELQSDLLHTWREEVALRKPRQQ